MKYWRLPLDAEEQVIPVGVLHIIADRCKGCGFCIEFCPNGILSFSEGFNRKGYHPPEGRATEGCINCGICAVICPEFAIYTTVREERCFGPGDLERYEELRSAGGRREEE